MRDTHGALEIMNFKTNRPADDKSRGSICFLRPCWGSFQTLNVWHCDRKARLAYEVLCLRSEGCKHALGTSLRIHFRVLNQTFRCLGSEHQGWKRSSLLGPQDSLYRLAHLCLVFPKTEIELFWLSFLGSWKGRGGLVQNFHRETSRNPFNMASLMF